VCVCVCVCVCLSAPTQVKQGLAAAAAATAEREAQVQQLSLQVCAAEHALPCMLQQFMQRLGTHVFVHMCGCASTSRPCGRQLF